MFVFSSTKSVLITVLLGIMRIAKSKLSGIVAAFYRPDALPVTHQSTKGWRCCSWMTTACCHRDAKISQEHCDGWRRMLCPPASRELHSRVTITVFWLEASMLTPCCHAAPGTLQCYGRTVYRRDNLPVTQPTHIKMLKTLLLNSPIL